MRKPKFILLNGFAGSGKTTIAQRYITEHPLALVVESDELIVNLGQWLKNESEARVLVFEMIKSLVSMHLSKGHDVILPYLVTDARHSTEFELIATQHGASFYNVLLDNQKEVAIQRLLARGTWGEAGTDPLADKDVPEIDRLYNLMEQQLNYQDAVIIIDQTDMSVDDTYGQVIKNVR